MQARLIHIAPDITLKVPGTDLKEIVTVLNTICDHINAWSETFTHNFDVTFRTNFPAVVETRGFRKPRAPVAKINIWGKVPEYGGHRTVICFNLITHDGLSHSAYINDLKFPEARIRLNRILKRFKKELERDEQKRNDSPDQSQAGTREA